MCFQKKIQAGSIHFEKRERKDHAVALKIFLKAKFYTEIMDYKKKTSQKIDICN